MITRSSYRGKTFCCRLLAAGLLATTFAGCDNALYTSPEVAKANADAQKTLNDLKKPKREVMVTAIGAMERGESAPSRVRPVALVLGVKKISGDFAKEYRTGIGESGNQANVWQEQSNRSVQDMVTSALVRRLTQSKLFSMVLNDPSPEIVDLTLDCALDRFTYEQETITTMEGTDGDDISQIENWHMKFTFVHRPSISASFLVRPHEGRPWKFEIRKTWPPKSSSVRSKLGDADQDMGKITASVEVGQAYCSTAMGEFLDAVVAEIESRRDEIASLEPPRDPPYSGPVKNRWAVVIGVSEYKHASAKLPSLKYAHRDAEDLAAFLRSEAGGSFAPDHVRLLTDRQATLSNVREALGEFLKKSAREDMVVVYLSGHGVPDPAKPSNLYFLAHDSDPADLAATAFPMWDLRAILDKTIPADRVVVFVDSCHAAAVKEGIKGTLVGDQFSRYLEQLARRRSGRLILAACGGEEVSREGDQWGGGHGVFTWALLEGLRGKADGERSGTVTLGGLLDYVQSTVRRETDNRQNPTRAGTQYDRDLPLARKARVPSTSPAPTPG